VVEAPVPWLVHDGKVLATLEVASSPSGRMRGLLDRDLTVLRIVTMRPNRLGVPVLKARSVIEAEAGAFERWGIGVGDRLEIKGST
jgi:uncharacterized membrane protein (UPF0127 family)